MPELRDIAQTAQSRNRREAITGVMLYDEARFFQWLEGPSEGIARVMHSIESDRRHTEVDVLHSGSHRGRSFGDWAMKLALLGAPASTRDSDIIEPPRDIVETLRRQPKAAPVLLSKLFRSETAVPDFPVHVDVTTEDWQRPLQRRTAAVLKAVILAEVLPGLLRRHQVPDPVRDGWPFSPRAAELADLLLQSDQAAALGLIRELRGQNRAVSKLNATLVEPAARVLGDLWREDACSGLELSVALSRLQTAMRLLSVDMPRAIAHGGEPAVLIAPMPGELHQLGAMLDQQVLWHAGWEPRPEYPADDRALQDIVSGAWIDVLDLSLSLSLRRDESMARLAATVTAARAASRNPALMVVVGGRIFGDPALPHADVGADLESRTSMHLDRLIAGAIDEQAVNTAVNTKSRRH